MSDKFKVGDRIRGLKGNGCRFTNEQMLEGKVVETFADNMRIKIENHSDADYVGRKYVATNSTEKFELIKSTKAMLQPGDRVYARNLDDPGFVLDEGIYFLKDGFLDMRMLDDDLMHIKGKNEYDIVKVERSNSYEVVFEREAVKEMTLEEVSELVGCAVKIVEKEEEK